MGATGNHLIASLVNNKTVNEAKLFDRTFRYFFSRCSRSRFSVAAEKKNLFGFRRKLLRMDPSFIRWKWSILWLWVGWRLSLESRYQLDESLRKWLHRRSRNLEADWSDLTTLAAFFDEKVWRVWRSRPVHVFKEAILMLQRPKGSRLSIFTKVPWVVNKSLWWHHFSF